MSGKRRPDAVEAEWIVAPPKGAVQFLGSKSQYTSLSDFNCKSPDAHKSRKFPEL